MSSSSRGNLAVTKDGEPYNKLRRPEDFGASTCPPPPSGKVVPTVPPAADSNKRKQENADVTEDDEQDVKRSKKQHGTPKFYDRKSARKQVHPGVQSTFLGIDDSDHDSADSTTNEALAYLRSVRSEASAIPSLLVAPPAALADDEPDRSMYTSGRGDHSVVYRDGAWIAVDWDDEEEEYWSDEQCDLDPQEEYYKQLLRRYNALRNTLARLDHREFAKMRDADPERFANQKPPQSRHWWLYTLDREYPTPAQVAQIDQRTLYQGLQFCTHSLDRFDTISKQKSCWIWTLLALAGEIGTLDNPKVGQIRDLGHKAGQLRIRLRGGSIRRLREEENEDKEDGNGNGEGEVTVYKNDKCGGGEVEAEDKYWEGGVQETGQDIEMSNDSEVHGNNITAPEEVVQPPEDEEEEGYVSDHSADMSISEEEKEAPKDDEAITLEEARARLFAQLGDRLVQPKLPSKEEAGPQQQRRRHRHNGKVCHDPNCGFGGRGQKTQPNTGPRVARANETKPNRPESSGTQRFASRAEAERQRQQMREQEMERPVMDYGEVPLGGKEKLKAGDVEMPVPAKQDPAPKKASKPFASRAEAEAHREKQGFNGQAEESSQEEQKESRRGDDAKVSADGDASGVDLNTKATIDMILTVVAECYRQKDLLKYRELWGE